MPDEELSVPVAVINFTATVDDCISFATDIETLAKFLGPNYLSSSVFEELEKSNQEDNQLPAPNSPSKSDFKLSQFPPRLL